jgi:hypothetical protein
LFKSSVSVPLHQHHSKTEDDSDFGNK